MEEYNVIILGAGISGITCSIYLKRAGIKHLIIENNVPGGQLNKIDIIENYPGYKKITGYELSMNLLEQIQDVLVEYDNIIDINYDDKILKTGSKKYKYEYLVFATGRRERLLGINNEDNYIGRGISLCATCDGALYKDKEVVVVGGGNTALSEAIYLSNICKKVTLIHRRNSFRADNVLQDRIFKINNIDILYNNVIVDYLIDDNKITGIKLDNNKVISCDCVFLAIGSIPNSELFIGNKESNYIEVNEKYQTSINCVYACGDVIKKDFYQLVNASSEGAVVANNIIKSINGSDSDE